MKTEVVKINSRKPEKKVIQKAARIIKNGGVVAFPTETVYGLGANALSARAVKKIFKSKGRPSDNPLIVHISDALMLAGIVKEIPEKAIPLMKKFWPGPLTLVMKKTKKIPDIVTAGGDTIGIRMPAHPVALDLIRVSAVPIAAPSANISTRPSSTEAKHVLDDLGGNIPLILNGGKTSVGIESTVLDITSRTPTILRKGKVSKKDIEMIIGPIAEHAVKKRGKVKSPGQKHKHYAPIADLILVHGGTKKTKEVIKKYDGKQVFVITFFERKKDYRDAKKTLVLGKIGDESTAAKNLFSLLRECDRSGADIIVVEAPSRRGIGDALLDRISRGAKTVV